MGGWGEERRPSPEAGVGTSGQIEDAHRALDALGIPTGQPLALRVLEAVGRFDRTWPEQNQIEGLPRAIALLAELTAVLRLTSAGRHPRFPLGREPSIGDLLAHHLDALERLIVPAYGTARLQSGAIR